MCYNKEVSLGSYITGMLLCLYLYKIGNSTEKHVAVVFAVVVQMQLAEYLMWIDQDCTKGYNHWGNMYAALILELQFVSILFAGYYFDTFLINKKILLFVCFLCTLVFIHRTMSIFTMYENQRLCAKEKKTGFLEWDFTKDFLPFWQFCYFFTISVLWFFVKDRKVGITFFLLGVVTILYSCVSKSKNITCFEQWESRWCIYTNVVPLVLILRKKFFT